MNVKKFIQAVYRREFRRPLEASPYGILSVFEEDAARIGSAQKIGKWGDVEYYGPAAAAAEQRRSERLEGAQKAEGQPLCQKSDKQPDKPKRPNRKRQSVKQLQKTLARLEAEVKDLENAKR